MYKLSFYVPKTHLETVKTALFAAGAGRMHGYADCAWQTLGEGQFRPLPDSQPFLGTVYELETVAEYKVEMVCENEVIKTVLTALLAVHPYQQPAYSVNPILTMADFT